MKKYIPLIYSLGLLGFLFLPGFVFAQTPAPSPALLQVQTDLGTFATIGEFVSEALKWITPLLGSIAVLLVIYAGFLYMTSQGNSENISTAKELLLGTILGLLLLFTAQILLSQVIGTIPPPPPNPVIGPTPLNGPIT